MIYIIINQLHTHNFILTITIKHLFEMNINLYRSYSKNLLSVSTEIPLHNICLIVFISQNGLIIIEKKKVNNYVVCRPFGMITS